MNKNTFIYNESLNNYEMFNRQSTSGTQDAINRLRFIENTNSKSEVPSTKKETPIEQHRAPRAKNAICFLAVVAADGASARGMKEAFSLISVKITYKKRGNIEFLT